MAKLDGGTGASWVRPLDNDVSGRLGVVTGASGGIGSACARALAQEGCDLGLHYHSNPDSAAKLASELRAKHPAQTFTLHRANLSNREETQSLISSVLQAHAERHRSISIIVLNAGLARRIRDVADISLQDWEDVIQVNCTSPFILLKSCLDDAGGKMRTARWGRVVLIGSISSKGGGINGCHYAASKGALCSMGLNLARVLAPDNITVNCISPALIGDTGMVPAVQPPRPHGDPTSTGESGTLQLADIGTQLASTIPLGRLGHPSEVANVVVMLAKTGYMTGQEIVLGGGLH
ncbi:hypothetical protein PtA15_10A115 [Puccinia triticina]|uniref:Ketoreductase domain-containing protein n=1 Tax=Puccinia triticina TaxID=208348 RepID=A0ABY7CTX1_9BASI|nr:uncharacterized protein PtA15_10A115 [Puccinia triticina]WAQ88696.1 hypothetical protein PtA15_10A115 [Puccinia triticina]